MENIEMKNFNRRYLKRVSGFTALQIAALQGWRAAEHMKGRNHYPVGSKRHTAWQNEYDKSVLQINAFTRDLGDDMTDSGWDWD